MAKMKPIIILLSFKQLKVYATDTSQTNKTQKALK